VTVGTTTFFYDTRGSVKGFGDKTPLFPKPLPYYGKFYDNGGVSIALNSGRSDLNWPVYRYAETLLLYRRGGERGGRPGERVRGDQPGARARRNAGAGRTLTGAVPRLGATGAKLGARVRVEAAVRPQAWGLYEAVVGNDPVSKVAGRRRRSGWRSRSASST
jgi:hypothetical protein